MRLSLGVAMTKYTHCHTHRRLITLMQVLGEYVPNFSLIGPADSSENNSRIHTQAEDIDAVLFVDFCACFFTCAVQSAG